MHKKNLLSGVGGVTSSSSSFNPPKDEAGGVRTTKMMALVELPLALKMIDPLSPNYNEAEDPCVQGSQRKGGVASSSSSSLNPKDEAGVLTKATTMEMMVHVDAQPLRLQKAIVPSSSPRHYEAEGRRRRGQGSQQQRRVYVCVDCNTSFNSHYALGGHRSSKHSRKRLQQQTLLLPPAAPNNNNNQEGLLLRRSQRLRLFGVNLDVVPAASSS